MAEPLAGEVAIVPGGSRGIGLAIAQAFASGRHRTRSPAGARWLPELQTILDSQRLFPAEVDGRWVTFLASGDADDLSGRVLSVTHDMSTLVERRDEIRREGQYALRLIE